jgi:DNA-binding transcriptional ArsR family regulator
MKPVSDVHDPKLAKAMAHPLRVRILAILDTGRASPSDLASELGVPVENVAYHVRVLRQYGLVRLVRRAVRGAAVQHYYESVTRPRVSDEAWGRLPKVAKRAAVATSLEEIGDLVNGAAQAGGFDAADIHLTRRALALDDAGFREAAELLRQLSDDLAQLEKTAASRSPDRAAALVLMLFERSDRA